MTEAEWKLFRKLRELALDRFCERTLVELAKLSSRPGKTNHERYLTVYKRLRQRDRELADAFDGLSRSAALRQLAMLVHLKLLTDEEYEGFRPETRESVQVLLS